MIGKTSGENFVGIVIWEDGTEEELKWFAPSLGTSYEFETTSGYYLFRQADKTTRKRLPYDYEDEYYPWEESDKKVKKIQYTTTIY